MVQSKVRIAALGLIAALGSCDCPAPPPAPPAPPAAPPTPPVVAKVPQAPLPPPILYDVRVGRVAPKTTLGRTLNELGVSGEEIQTVVSALKGHFDFRKSRIGDQVRVSRKDGLLDSIEIRRSDVDEWLVAREGDGEAFVASKRQVVIETKRVPIDVAVRSSLYEAMTEAGEDPTLAVDIAEVFAWDLDFYRDVRAGDRIRIVVDKVYARGKLLRYGDIYGVRYEGAVVGTRRLMRYTTILGDTSYFDERGTSAKKPFLKTPLKFVHVTSHFGSRANPLSGFQQNHLGVDLAAEIGTPVWAVGDGIVTSVIHNDPGGGNFVFVRHTNGYETGYLHLSRFAPGLSVGTRVSQKQVIAFTGNTGMSTGPHLHYAMKRGGHYINPLSVKFPRSEPLSSKELPRFHEMTSEIASLLDAEKVATLVRSSSESAAPAEPQR